MDTDPKWKAPLLWTLAGVALSTVIAVLIFGGADIRWVPALLTLALFFALPELTVNPGRRRFFYICTGLACVFLIYEIGPPKSTQKNQPVAPTSDLTAIQSTLEEIKRNTAHKEELGRSVPQNPDTSPSQTAATPKQKPKPQARLVVTSPQPVLLKPPQSQPTKPIVRMGTGPDAYKDVDNLQVSEWVIQESVKLNELIQEAETERPNTPNDAKEFFFQGHFQECCEQDLRELRTEVLRRLGPPRKDPDEITAWMMLFPEGQPRNFPFPNSISLGTVDHYVPYLRSLGIQLRHTVAPKEAPIELHFSETVVGPNQFKMPYNIVITIRTKAEKSYGYIITIFDGPPGAIMADMADATYSGISPLRIDPELARYIHNPELHTYALTIGKTPLMPETPIHIFASGGGAPFHVAKVILLDE